MVCLKKENAHGIEMKHTNGELNEEDRMLIVCFCSVLGQSISQTTQHLQKDLFSPVTENTTESLFKVRPKISKPVHVSYNVTSQCDTYILKELKNT